jgi:hypothetical protein
MCLFRAYFPVVERPARSGAAQDTPWAPAIQRGTETKLLAEDHESIREMARHTLLGLRYRVLAACDAEEALQPRRSSGPGSVGRDNA